MASFQSAGYSGWRVLLPPLNSKATLIRLAIGVWVVLVILAVGRASLSHLPRHRGSFTMFVEGARHWQAGEDLYDHTHSNSLNVFRYAPLVAVLLAPLAWLPDAWGNAALRLVGLAVFLPALWWWWNTVRARGASATPQPTTQRAWFFLLVAALCNHSLMDVQLTILTLGLLLITAAAAAEERWTVAALACSLAIGIKAYPLSLALCLVLLFPRPFAWRLLAALMLGVALPFVFQNPAYVYRQYDEWLHFGLNARYVDNWFCDVMTFGQRWGMPMSRPTYQVLEVLSGMGIALCCCLPRWRRLPRPVQVNTIFGVCCAWMLAFGPATEVTTYVLLAPAAAAATLLAWTRPQPWWYKAAITGSCLVLSLAQLELLFPIDKPLEQLAALPLAAVVFLIAVAIRGLGDLESVPEGESLSEPRPLGSGFSRLSAP